VIDQQGDGFLAMPGRPGIITSAAREVRALVGPMERVGMSPRQWFAVLSPASGRITKEAVDGLEA
jgi:hypothetical protein